MVREWKFVFFNTKIPNSAKLHYPEPGLNPSITKIFKSMNRLIQERHKGSDKTITIKMSRRTQNLELYLANEKFGFPPLVLTLATILEAL